MTRYRMTSSVLSLSCELSVILENHLQGELHRARAAHLIQGRQATQRVCECELGLAEGHVCAMLGSARRRRSTAPAMSRSKVGVVEYVEGLSPELQLQVFVNRKFAADCQVHLPRA